MPEMNEIIDLPVEVISHIFRFLPHSDIKEARLVCKQWYEASLDPVLLDREKTVCKFKEDHPFEATLMSSKRSFLHLEIVDCWLTYHEKHKTTIWCNKEFWRRFGPKLRSLLIGQCPVAQCVVELLEVLRCCASLRSLKIAYCSGINRGVECPALPPFKMEVSVLPKLPQLHTVTISRTPNAKWLFDILVLGAPNLATLNFLGDLVIDDDYPELTCLDLIDYVDRNAERDFDLSLALSSYSDFQAYETLVSLPNARIRALEIAYVMEEIPPEWLEFLSIQIWLLSLSLICVCDDDLLEAVCANLPLLEHLDVSCATDIFHGLRNIAFLKNLTTLRMVLCYKADDESFLYGLCSSVNTTMKELTLTVLELSYDCIVELARTHPALTYLNLTRCRGVTNRSVQAIFYYQVSLKTLILDRCAYLTDAGLGGMRMSEWDSDVDRGHVATPTGYSISRLKNLRTLSLDKCNLDGSSFENGLRIPDLRFLILSHNNQIPKSAFERLFENNNRIETLSVQGCLSVTDELLQVMKEKLQRLRRLDVSDCMGVTAEGIDMLCRDRDINIDSI